MQKSAGKIAASIFFWNQDGTLFIDYFRRGQYNNAEYYLPVLVQLKDFLKEKRRCIFTKSVLVLHENVQLLRHLQTKQTGLHGAPLSWSSALLSGSCLVGLPSVPWSENSIQNRHF